MYQGIAGTLFYFCTMIHFLLSEAVETHDTIFVAWSIITVCAHFLVGLGYASEPLRLRPVV